MSVITLRLSWTRRLVVLWLVSSGVVVGAPAESTLDAARATVQRADLDETRSQSAIADLDAAAEAERAADALVARTLELRAESDGLPARLTELQKALEVDRERAIEAWESRLPKAADAETLERLLQQERRTVAELQSQIDATGTELALELSRPVQAAAEIAALRRRIEELSVPAPALEGAPAPVNEARRLRRAAELRRVQANLDLHLLEQDTASQRQRYRELRLRELRLRLGLHQRHLEVLQRRIADLGRQALESRRERLIAQQRELADGPQVVALAAAQNRALGEELLEAHERLAYDRRTLASVEEERDYVAEALRASRTRLELGGTSERVGRWLWSERQRLERPARLRQQLESTRVALADLRVRLFALDDQQREVADVPAAVRALQDASRAEADDEASDAGTDERLLPLLRERAELLTLLRPLLERRVAALEQRALALDEQVDATLVLQRLLDRHLLWLPSHGGLGAAWLERVPEGLYDLVKPSRFLTTFELCMRSAGERPALWLGSLALLLGLTAVRLRAPARITAAATITRHVREDSYTATVRALAWTVASALPAPVALALAGQLLQQVGSAGRFSDSLGRACLALVAPALAVQLLRWSVIDGGLAHAHFRWLRPRRETLRHWLVIAAAVLLPTYFVVVLASVRRVDLAIDVQARLALFAASVALAWILWRLLEPGRVWIVRGPTLEPSLARRVLRVMLPALFLAQAGLALAGYVYSAAVALRSALASFVVIVLVAIVMGLIARWFLLGERRLALRRAEERRAAAMQVAADAGDIAPEVQDEAISLEQVGEHTGRLLRAVRVSLLAVGLVAVWSDVLPAIYRLDEIALWTVTGTGADGTPVEQPVTAAALLLGLFTLVLTVIGSRNLPGLIEITLLSRAGVDAASRYAMTSVLRYAIVIGGTILGLSLLGLRWSQLQWMAAALTVGLGFGLQEIFANFVSGLILLFERPFRVGDTITVGDLSGKVTRIRTRATTILDFDNKEIVVPNKSFITGQLINWTLTDTTTRIIIKVGVAYGSDPALVRRLLQQAAAEDPRVLKEPPPTTWFLAFGASSLDFELRVFVGTLADRLEVQSALNTEITRLFAEHGVEIAFPQLDLHVRDLPAT